MQPRLVLVRPRNADNLVAIAQAMRTFGLEDWVAVSQEKYLVGILGVLAKHRAEAPSLGSLRRVDTFSEAVRGCSYVVGTTMREVAGKPSFSTRELAELMRERTEPWALVFGAESTGLTPADLVGCDALSFIPAHAAQPSLNLSQAVVVYAHELYAARRDAALSTSLHAAFGPALVDSVLRGSPTAQERAAWQAVCEQVKAP